MKYTSTLLILLIFLLHCQNNSKEDTRQKATSAIQPKALLIPTAKRINLLSPGPVQTISAGAHTFFFDSRGLAYASLMIYDKEVSVAEIAAGASGNCVGGATSLAGHVFNGTSLLLATSLANSQLYACQSGNPSEPLSKTVKIQRSNLAATSNYFWVLLGYNSSYILTHSSPIYKFKTP